MNTITDQLADALRLLDNVTAMTDSEADSLGQAENILRSLLDVQRDAHAAFAGDHTPGPWVASTYSGPGMERGACVMVGDDTVLDLPFAPAWPEATQRANARRIVACVNACSAIPTAQLEGGPLAPSPRIGIKMEGGVIQNVFADTEAAVYVIDYDVEDAAPPDGYENEDHAVCQLEQDGGGTAECVLSRYGAEVSPRWFQRMDAALAVRSAELDEEQESAEAPRP